MGRLEGMLRETSTSQGQLKTEMKATINTNHEKAEASQERLTAIIAASQEKEECSKDEMKAKTRTTINPSQEETKTAVYAIQSAQTRFEETISKQVEGIMELIYKWTKSLYKQFSSEMQEAKENFCQEQGSKMQGTEVDIKTKKYW
jgi:hypothetical protein